MHETPTIWQMIFTAGPCKSRRHHRCVNRSCDMNRSFRVVDGRLRSSDADTCEGRAERTVSGTVHRLVRGLGLAVAHRRCSA